MFVGKEIRTDHISHGQAKKRGAREGTPRGGGNFGLVTSCTKGNATKSRKEKTHGGGGEKREESSGRCARGGNSPTKFRKRKNLFGGGKWGGNIVGGL